MRRRLAIGGTAGAAAGLFVGFPVAAHVGLEVFYRNFGTPNVRWVDPAGYAVWGSFCLLGGVIGAGVAYFIQPRE